MGNNKSLEPYAPPFHSTALNDTVVIMVHLRKTTVSMRLREKTTVRKFLYLTNQATRDESQRIVGQSPLSTLTIPGCR